MTSTPARLQPRKRPVQARAHETRDRILASAARVFAAHGYAAGTTNRIAAEAGLSVGSLYQYFPNKDAILVELVRDHARRGMERIVAVVADEGFAGAPLRRRLERLVDATIDLHRGDGRLHQVLFEEAPRPPALLAELRQMEAELVDSAEAMLRADPEVTVEDPATAARLVVATIESTVHRLLATGGPAPAVADVREQLVAMLSRYLTG